MRELNARRRQEQLKDALNDDEPARVLEDLVKVSPALAAIFQSRHASPQPVRTRRRRKAIRRETVPNLFPHCPRTGSGPDQKLPNQPHVPAAIRDRRRKRVLQSEPGTIVFSPTGITRAWNLRNGMVGATYMLPPNARVGDHIQVEVRVTDSTQAEPFISRFKIAVAAAATDREPSPPGPQKPRGGNMLAMPEIIPVTRDGREVDGRRVSWGTDFNKLTALEIRPAGDEGKYDIFVNMDNIHLLDRGPHQRTSEQRTPAHRVLLQVWPHPGRPGHAADTPASGSER